MSRPIASTLIALLVLGSTPATGDGQAATRDALRDQASARMIPGARVRVKLPRGQSWTATLISLTDDSMLVRGGASGTDTALVSLSQLSRLDVSAGMRRSPHLVRNTAILLVVGGGLGWFVGEATSSGGCSREDACWQNPCNSFCLSGTPSPVPPVTDHAVVGTVVGGLVGGGLGLLASMKRSEDWRRVSVTPRRTAVVLSPGRGGVSLRF
jgi:hypothetical protein